MKLTKCAVALALAGSMAVSAAWASDEKANQAFTAENLGSSLTPERKKEIERTARLIAEHAQNAANSSVGQRFAPAAEKMARRADDIANAALAEDRDKVLEFLGIDPKGSSSVYYFVSYEMPIEVLRAYVVEAMWSGGTLIFRGIPPGRDFGKFVTEDMRALVYGKGASAALSIDPRLFDSYGVTAVPTIVYTEDRNNLMCFGVSTKEFKYGTDTLSYETCPAVDEKKYWKISGAVTSDYAFRAFIEAGAAGAQVHLNALAKGLANGVVAPKNQQPFAGEWKDAVTPAELAAVRSAVDTATQAAAGPVPPPSK